MLKIFGYSASINVRKVLWLCEELNLPFVREDWAGDFRSTSEPQFRALNPVGMVPVIDDCGVIVWESNVILRYLASSRGRLDLLPSDAGSRAQIEQWMDWQGSDFNNSWRFAFQGLVRKNPAFGDVASIERSCAEFSRMVGIIDTQLERTGGHIAARHFTLADIPIGLSLQRWRSIPMTRPTFANVDRYRDLLLDHSGFIRYGQQGGS